MKYSRRYISLIIALIVVSLILAGSAKAGHQKPKNIIVMISDGCGYNHVDAAGLYQYGKTGAQVYEEFPVKLAMSTYAIGQSYDPQKAWKNFGYVSSPASYTDSAAAATAMSTGVKTYNGAIGIAPDGVRLRHIIDAAEQMGKATGVITTVPLSHATPAGFVAHSKSRNSYEDIANEMIYKSPLEVIMGCGHPFYDNDGKPAPKANKYKYVGGEKTWNDLSDGTVTGADANGDGIADDWTAIEKRTDFQALMIGQTAARIIGIARAVSTLQQRRSGDCNAAPYFVPLNQNVPTLEEMTKAALNVLDNDKDGFFLMVEGGAVDWAGHANQSGRLIEEQIDFNKSVKAVITWVEKKSNWAETLVIVTSDHETGYMTGPNSGSTEQGPVWNILVSNGAGKVPAIQWHSNAHTNSLVPFYAKGTGAEIFIFRAEKHDPVRGPYIDNTDIAKVIFSLLK